MKTNIFQYPSQKLMNISMVSELLNVLETYHGLYILTHLDFIWSASLYQDFLALGSWDKTVSIWSISESRQIAKILGHSDIVKAVTFTPDGSYIISGSKDSTIRVYEFPSLLLKSVLLGHTNHV